MSERGNASSFCTPEFAKRHPNFGALPLILAGAETNGLHLVGHQGNLDHSISLVSNPHTTCLICVLTMVVSTNNATNALLIFYIIVALPVSFLHCRAHLNNLCILYI